MKTLLCCLGGAVIGIITTILGCGWFSENGLNPEGIILNIILTVLWSMFVIYQLE